MEKRRPMLVLVFSLMAFAVLTVLPASAAVSVSGYVKLDIQYSDKILGGGAPSPSPAATPLDTNKEADNSQTLLDARQSRVRVNFDDTVGGIKLSGRIETDFFTGDGNALVSNSRHLRLRLAYAQGMTPGGFTMRAGQTRTLLSEYGDNLVGGVGAPEIINENAHFTQLQARQPAIHIAWTQKAAGGDFTIGGGVEKNSVDVKDRTGLSAAVDERQGSGQELPLFGGGVRYRSPLFSVFARGAISRPQVVFEGTGDDEDKTVWLGAVSVEVKPTTMLKFVGQYWFSDGLNRINGTFDDAALVGTSLEGVEAQAFLVGGQLRATKDLRFNAAYERMEADNDPKIFDLSATSADKETIQTFWVNFIYRFWTRWDTGLEYQWAKVESFGASEGTLNLVNFRLRFYF